MYSLPKDIVKRVPQLVAEFGALSQDVGGLRAKYTEMLATIASLSNENRQTRAAANQNFDNVAGSLERLMQDVWTTHDRQKETNQRQEKDQPLLYTSPVHVSYTPSPIHPLLYISPLHISYTSLVCTSPTTAGSIQGTAGSIQLSAGQDQRRPSSTDQSAADRSCRPSLADQSDQDKVSCWQWAATSAAAAATTFAGHHTRLGFL